MARAVAMVDQNDVHIANLTVRETLCFALKCQVRAPMPAPPSADTFSGPACHVPTPVRPAAGTCRTGRQVLSQLLRWVHSKWL